MTVPILIEQADGQFAARLVGQGHVCVIRPTREEALDAMKSELQERIRHGELVVVDLPDDGVVGLIGKYADDPSLSDICAEAYAERDRDRDELHQ